MTTWVKQTDEFRLRGRTVDSRKVRPFVPIAREAGERQIFKFVTASMLDGNDMLDFEWHRNIAVWEETILAPMIRSISNGTSHSRRHDRTRFGFNFRKR